MIQKKNGDIYRRRIPQPDTWIRNIRKAKRNSGESYVTKGGVIRTARNYVKEACPSTCRFGCAARFSDAQRDTFSKLYWSLPDLTSKRVYIIRHMEQVVPKYRRQAKGPTQRGLNYAYFFDENDVKVHVCRRFFLNTLNISPKVVAVAVQKFFSSTNVDLVEGERRGGKKLLEYRNVNSI